MASIIKKDLKSYVQFQVRYRIEGKQKAKNFTSTGKNITAIRTAEAAARKFKKDVEAENTLGLAKNESEMTFGIYAEHVFKERDKNAAPNTKNGRATHLKTVNLQFHNIKLIDITALMIEMFLSDMSKTKSDRTLSRYKQILNIVLEEATIKKIIQFNSMTQVRYSLSLENIKEVKPVEEEVFEIYSEQAKQLIKYYYVLEIMNLTGMRIGEATAIEIIDFNFKTNEFYVTKSRRQDGTLGPVKKNRNRKGIIHSALAELIYEIKEWQKSNKKKFGDSYQDHGLLICNEVGTPMKYSALKSYLSRMDTRTGIKIRSHQLRHTFISSLILKQGMNAKEVQILAGHAKVQTTLNVYTKLLGNKFEESTREKLEERFAKDYQKNKGL